MTRHRLTILDAIADENLFLPWMQHRATWATWRVALSALFALPMTAEQLAIYQQHTGRAAPPTEQAKEAWLVCGRRAGKSFVLALIAVYLAAFHDYRKHLAPGERGTVMVIATDRRQARVIMRYIRALLTQVPMIARMIERETENCFDLSNSVTIEIAAASFKAVRGYAVVAALCDEIAFWPTEDSAQPDYEILDALRPGMATIPGAMLLCASSPYARRGALWDAHRKHFAQDDDPILIWQADTRTMNPNVPQAAIDAAMERDPASAAAEYGAQFRSDVESFVNRENVEACVSLGVRERPPLREISYSAFVDPSGGSAESMTCAVGHTQDDVVVLDAIRERRPPFSPEDVVREFADLLKTYRITEVQGDRYGGEWPVERFREHGITYETAAKPKSDLYRDFLPLINSRKIELLDDDRLIAQIVGLERRTARGGRDSIDHAPGAHDDLANAVAGVVATLATAKSYDSLDWVSGPGVDARDAWQASRLWEQRVPRRGESQQGGPQGGVPHRGEPHLGAADRHRFYGR